MSVLGKKWVIKNLHPEELFSKIEDSVFHSHELFEDMQVAVSLVNDAIKKGERIMIFGDYDVDGITSTAIISHALTELGAQFSYRLPHRMRDGYGLSEKYIDEFIEKDVRLLITVDCGISCFGEILKAKNAGIKTIITDHHELPEEIPPADAIIHPKVSKKYPFKELTGAGVALKFAIALLSKGHFLIDPLIELSALGTVADLGPLIDENRFIVKEGLKNMKSTFWPGIKSLLDISGGRSEDEEIDTFTLGFKVAPRINSAGRIDDPYIGLSLLMQKEGSEKILPLAQKLDALNAERQQMTKDGVEFASAVVEGELPPIIILDSPDFHVGILGLIAGRLVEKYNIPAIALQDFGDHLVASARSTEYFHIANALATQKHLLITFGGHAQAAGFKIAKENFGAFKELMIEVAAKARANSDTSLKLEIESELDLSRLNMDFATRLKTLEPFGIGNQEPIFLLKQVAPNFISTVGKGSEHLKFSIKDDQGNLVSAIGFRLGEHAEALKKSSSIDIAFNLKISKYNGKSSLNLNIVDLAL